MRNLLAPVLLLLPVMLLAPGIARGDGGVPASTDASRDYVVTYRTVVPRPAEGAGLVEAWVPLPWEGEVQAVEDLKVEANASFDVTTDPETGNRLVHVRVQDPAGDVQITWSATVRRSYETGQEVAHPRPDFLEGDRLAPVDAAARAQAERLGADAEGLSVRERAHRIYEHVVDSTAYDKNEPGWGTGDFERVCRVGKGNCSDFTARFVTLARAAGIPARWVSTISLSDEHAGCDACGYHCYGHFLDGNRWVPVDPSDARRIRDRDGAKAAWYFGHAERANVILSVGRDLVLTPPQQGEPVNFLAGPYVEVDGRPVALEGKNRSYEYEAR